MNNECKEMTNRTRTSKVCILTSKHSYFDTRIFHKQALTLAEAGHEVTLIAPHNRDETIDNVKIIALPRSRTRLQRILGLDLLVLSLALKQKATVYHFHDPDLLPVGFLLRLLTSADVIYDIHEDYSGALRTRNRMPPLLGSLASKFYSLAERISLYILSSMVVAGEDLLSYLPNSSKVVLVRNYPPLDIANYVNRKTKPQGKGLVLIYTGGMSKERGIKEIVEAVDALDGKARLILLGSFSDPQLEDEIRKRASDNIQLIEWVPFEEVFRFMERADVGLVCFHPSPNNVAAASRNNKLFEYMSASLPVIASSFPAWKELVEGNNCGVTVNSINSQEIKEAIEYLINNPEIAEEMGRNGRKAVLEKYNWERESEKLLELYYSLTV